MAGQYLKIVNGVTTLTALDFVSDVPREELWIDADPTLGAITLNLPEISTLPFRNPKIYVQDSTGQAGTNNITIVRNAADRINGQQETVVINSNNGSASFHVSGGTNWAGSTDTNSGALVNAPVAAANQASFAGAPFTGLAVGAIVMVQNYNATGDAGSFQKIANTADTFADWRVLATELKASTGAIGSTPA